MADPKSPFIITLCHSGWEGRGAGNEGVKMSLGKRRGEEKFIFCFSPSKSILISNNQVESVLSMTVIGE